MEIVQERDLSEVGSLVVTEIGRDKHNHDPEQRRIGEIDQDSKRVSVNRDRIRCYKCREYDHYARECPNTITDED